MTFQQFLRILRARAGLIVAVTSMAVLTALAVSLVMPRKYTASTAVVVDVKSPDPIAGTVLPGLISPGYMATQVDIMGSHRVAQRVVKRLRLDEDPAFQQLWQDATQKTGDPVVWMANMLQKGLDVKPSRESNVINIEFGGRDPDFVAKVANAFAEAYVDIDVELKVQPARQNAAWFEEQARIVRDRLEQAQRAYSSYQQKAGIVASSERLDFETARLEELSTQLGIAQGESSASRGRSMSAGAFENMPEVIQNPLIVSLKTDVGRLESKLRESNVNLGRNHPQTKRMESELASLKTQLTSETRKIVTGIGTSYQVARQKEKGLQDAIEAQKSRILGLSKQSDEMRVLKRDVESAQRAFDDVSQRAAQTRLESLSVLTNVAILNPASVPTDPSSPKIKLNLLIALILGASIGTALAFMREFSNRYVRSPEDLIEALNLPLLAAIAHTAPAPVVRRRNWSLRRVLQPQKRLAAGSATRSQTGA